MPDLTHHRHRLNQSPTLLPGRVAFAVDAIVLSVLGTALTGLKQFFDPMKAYGRNAQALQLLQQLHQEIAVAVTCEQKTGPNAIFEAVIAADDKRKWIEGINKARGQIIPANAPVDYENLNKK